MFVLPSEIHLHTNTTCNLNCRHCYNNSGSMVGHFLPVSLALDCVKEFSDAEFHIEGGEIFLYREFLDRMNGLSEEMLRQITLTTNGTVRICDENLLSTLRRINMLRISVEGHTDEQQQAVRGIGLENILRNAEAYHDAGIPVALRLTLHSLNYNRFVVDTVASLCARGFQNLHVYEFQLVGRGTENDYLAVSHSISRLLNELCCYPELLPKEFRAMFPKKRYNEILEYQDRLEKAGFAVEVLPPESGISIHANGDMFLCPWDNETTHCIGNILEMGIANARNMLYKMELSHKCEYCSSIRIVKC